jgi:hypothetical protein
MQNPYEHLARYHADQHYDAYAPHLRDLHEQAKQSRMAAALGQRRTRLGNLLVALGAWLARRLRRDEPPA